MPFWWTWGYYSSPERAAEAYEALYGETESGSGPWPRIVRDDSRNPRWRLDLSLLRPSAEEDANREVIR